MRRGNSMRDQDSAARSQELPPGRPRQDSKCRLTIERGWTGSPRNHPSEECWDSARLRFDAREIREIESHCQIFAPSQAGSFMGYQGRSGESMSFPQAQVVLDGLTTIVRVRGYNVADGSLLVE